MADIAILRQFDLVPVVELEPYTFHRGALDFPAKAPGQPDAGASERYWLDSLALAGIAGLAAIEPGSWHVRVDELTDDLVLYRLLGVFAREWGVSDHFDEDYDDEDVLPFAFRGGTGLRGTDPPFLVLPGCCSDLAETSEWSEAAAYRNEGWKILWIGHPCLSVRYVDPYLVLSEPHESNDPVAAWAVDPAALAAASRAATTALERFAGRLAGPLRRLNLARDPERVARGLAGLGV